MSKKRKTKKQKVASVARKHIDIVHSEQITETAQHTHAPITYSLDVNKTAQSKREVPHSSSSSHSKVNSYVKRDVAKIMYTSAGILVFDVILFVLLHTHLLKLGFLGY